MSAFNIAKHPNEVIRVSADFTRRLANGDTLTGSPTVTRLVGDMTIGAGSLSGALVTFTASAGTDGTTTTVQVNCGTTNGETLVGMIAILASVAY